MGNTSLSVPVSSSRHPAHLEGLLSGAAVLILWSNSAQSLAARPSPRLPKGEDEGRTGGRPVRKSSITSLISLPLFRDR